MRIPLWGLFLIDKLLVRVSFIIVMIRWTDLRSLQQCMAARTTQWLQEPP